MDTGDHLEMAQGISDLNDYETLYSDCVRSL